MPKSTIRETKTIAQVQQTLNDSDYSEASAEWLHSNFHLLPPQFKEPVLDHFSKALADWGRGPTYNKIRKLRDSLLPKSAATPKGSQKAVEIAEKLLQREFFITIGERSKEINRYNRDTGFWTPDGRSYIEQWTQRNTEEKSEISTHLVNEVVGFIERETRESRSVFDANNEPPCLVLQNGILYLSTLLLEQFKPELYALNSLPVRYDPKADCPLFKQFVSEILSPEDVLGVQEEFGAILRRKYLTKKFSIYIGEPDTGKTTLISVLLKLLGTDNVSSVSIQDLASKSPFQVAPLYGKLANIRDDLPKELIYSAGRLKELTGGFQLQVEKKFQEQFNFTNSAYLIFTCNSLPPIQEDDDGFFVRVIIRNFAKKFGGHDKPDRGLLDKLTSAGELSGILNWAIEGYVRLQNNGWNFTNTTSLDVTYEDYKRKSDPVWAFVQDWLFEENESAEPKEALYAAFKLYCKLRGIPLISKDLFYKTLPSKVNVSSEYRTFEGLGRKHAFVGIKLNDSYHLNKEKGAQGDQVDHKQSKLDQSVHGVQGPSYLIASEKNEKNSADSQGEPTASRFSNEEEQLLEESEQRTEQEADRQ